MKKHFVLDYSYELGFVVLGLNCHSKAYKLCWFLNQKLELDFEKAKDHNIKNQGRFTRYSYTNQYLESHYDLLVNRSKEGYLIPSKKSVNYFLKVESRFWKQEKEEFIRKIKEIPEILLIFELELKTNNELDKFIFNDTKN